jgi:prolyl 4-hydroxylase
LLIDAPFTQYKPHHDWFHHENQLQRGGQRISTFFTYLQSNCSFGETEFLNVKFDHDKHRSLCHILACDDQATAHGIRFRPIAGNSVFWSNVNATGQVDERTLHAGRPPGPNGWKIALNTWTRERIFE